MNRTDRQTAYRTLCEEGRITQLFMQAWWLDATGEWDAALAYRNDRLVGAMPYAPGRRFGIPVLGMPALTHHLWIWMDKPPDISAHKWLTREKQIIWSLVESLPKYGFLSLVFAGDSFDNWLPFYWKGFRQEMRYTFVVDRQDPALLDQQINRNLKRNLREAGAHLTVGPCEDLRQFYDICAGTYARQRMRVPFSYALLDRLDTAIMAREAGVRLAARDADGRVLSVAYVLWDHDRAYYFLAGDSDAGRAAGAGVLLGREAMRIAFEEQGVRLFDFCGSMLEPITEIRRQFGARAEPLMKIYRAGYKWLDVAYALRR